MVAFLTEGIMLDQQGKTLGIDVCAEMNHSKITFLIKFDLKLWPEQLTFNSGSGSDLQPPHIPAQ